MDNTVPEWTPEMVDLLHKRFENVAAAMGERIMYNSLNVAMNLVDEARAIMLDRDGGEPCRYCSSTTAHHYDGCRIGAFLKKTGPAKPAEDDE